MPNCRYGFKKYVKLTSQWTQGKLIFSNPHLLNNHWDNRKGICWECVSADCLGGDKSIVINNFKVEEDCEIISLLEIGGQKNRQQLKADTEYRIELKEREIIISQITTHSQIENK